MPWIVPSFQSKDDEELALKFSICFWRGVQICFEEHVWKARTHVLQHLDDAAWSNGWKKLRNFRCWFRRRRTRKSWGFRVRASDRSIAEGKKSTPATINFAYVTLKRALTFIVLYISKKYYFFFLKHIRDVLT